MPATTRLLELLSLLQTGREWPGSLLASRLGTSARTIRRDVGSLREMGYNIRAAMGRDGGYRLDAGSELPPLLFDADQAVAIAIALQTAPTNGADIAEAAIRALATIRQVMPPHLRHRVDALEVTTVPRAGDGEPMTVSVDVLSAVANAVRAREELRFDYVARDTTGDAPALTTARRAEPIHLVASHGRWYLLGWDLDHDEWRIYSVDRVRPRTPNGPPFRPRTVPGGNVSDFVSARFKGSDVNRWPCYGTVILDLPAREVLPFAGDGTVTAIDNDRCALEIGSWSWGALAASLGRFEVPVQVVEPPELAAAFGTLADRYRTTSMAGPVATASIHRDNDP